MLHKLSKCILISCLVLCAPDNCFADADALRDAIAQKLQDEVPTGSFSISIEVREDEVTLTGRVASAEESKELESLAKSVEGVRSVANQLEIDPALPSRSVESKSLADLVTQRIKNLSSTQTHSVTINVNGVQVTLGGEVSSEAQREEIESLVWGTSGVRNVINNIKVQAALPDEKIRIAVLDSINASTALSNEDLKIDVKDGVVTISGIRKDTHQVGKILSSALMVEGVVDVKNEIKTSAKK